MALLIWENLLSLRSRLQPTSAKLWKQTLAGKAFEVDNFLP